MFRSTAEESLVCFFLPFMLLTSCSDPVLLRPAVKKLSVWRTRVFTVHYLSVIVSCVCFLNDQHQMCVCLVTRAPESWSPAPSLTSPLRQPLTLRWAETKIKKKENNHPDCKTSINLMMMMMMFLFFFLLAVLASRNATCTAWRRLLR